MAGGARGNSAQKKPTGTLTERMSAWKRRKDSVGMSWRDVDSQSLKAAIHAIIAADCAVMFARARGGDGVMVKVYDEGEPASEFAATAEEMTEMLDALVGAFGNSAEDLYAAMAPPSESVSLAAD